MSAVMYSFIYGFEKHFLLISRIQEAERGRELLGNISFDVSLSSLIVIVFIKNNSKTSAAKVSIPLCMAEAHLAIQISLWVWVFICAGFSFYCQKQYIYLCFIHLFIHYV